MGAYEMKIALLNAHTSYSPGVYRYMAGKIYSEYKLSRQINTKIKDLLALKEINSFIVDASNITPYSHTLSYKSVAVNEGQADYAVETHFNAAPSKMLEKTSCGLEVLYGKDRPDCKKFAEVMVDCLADYLPFKIRRNKTGLYENKKIYILKTIACPVVLIEPCFLTHPIDRLFLLHPRATDILASAIMTGILTFHLGR